MRVDGTTLLGILIGVGGILLGNSLEGGHLSSLFQGTAALIVIGGTLGATLVSQTKKNIELAVYYLKLAFQKDEESRINEISKEIIACATIAKKDSILSIETRIKTFKSPFMQNVFRHLVDGVPPEKIEDVFIGDIQLEEERKLNASKVWSEAAGYSPTIGIIGAVLGLIHVMSNLTNTDELGRGIAVAFVATIYGVGLANLILLPIANKIKKKIELETLEKEMILDGAIFIAKDYGPQLVAEKMRTYQTHGQSE